MINALRKILNRIRLELLSRMGQTRALGPRRESLLGALQQARAAGLRPSTVVDVGAAYGDFTRRCLCVYPESRYILVEPLREYGGRLKKLASVSPAVEVVSAVAASSIEDEVVINVHPDLVGSSLYLEDEDSDVNGAPRTVPAVTLDGLCQDKGLTGPYLVKVDVQGAEIDVLNGAENVLREAEFVLLELSFFQFFQGGPQFYDVVLFMKERGFVAYDIFGLQYRMLDNALSQADVAFVKEDGALRKHNFYATREQRKILTRQLQAAQGAG